MLPVKGPIIIIIQRRLASDPVGPYVTHRKHECGRRLKMGRREDAKLHEAICWAIGGYVTISA